MQRNEPHPLDLFSVQIHSPLRNATLHGIATNYRSHVLGTLLSGRGGGSLSSIAIVLHSNYFPRLVAAEGCVPRSVCTASRASDCCLRIYSSDHLQSLPRMVSQVDMATHNSRCPWRRDFSVATIGCAACTASRACTLLSSQMSSRCREALICVVYAQTATAHVKLDCCNSMNS